MAKDEIDALAEQYALGRGGRSARAARQFVDSLIASVKET
jgi:predicted AAA+ superfamily ATPase